MAVSHLAPKSALLALLAASASAQMDFHPNDELYKILDGSPNVSQEEALLAQTMKDGLISVLGLKPIHVDQGEDQASNQTGSEDKQRKQKHGRIVEYDLGGLGWDWAAFQGNEVTNLGISENFTTQVALGWKSPIFLDTIDRFTLVSAKPEFNFEVIGSFTFTIHLNMFELGITIDLYPFKFTPFDFMFRLDATKPKRNCWGFDYAVETLAAEVKVDTRVNECYWGLGGLLADKDAFDCRWMTYKPDLPVWDIRFESITNITGHYVDYECKNWYTAGWENWPLSEEYINVHTN